jgi:putative cell wall-binding protein
LSGPDRFATAAAVMEAMRSKTDVFLVQGRDGNPARGWPDALAVSGLAAAASRPILLTDTGTLPDPTREALQRTSGTVTVVGGEASVAPNVVDDIRATGREVRRIAGTNRYETSKMVASLSASMGMDATRPSVVTGRNWPDALAAGAAVGGEGTVLLLVDGSDPSGGGDSLAWLTERQGSFRTVQLIGGAQSIQPSVEAVIEGAATRVE